jgi:uncharacterized tellurite resistance protein B-like protein
MFDHLLKFLGSGEWPHETDLADQLDVAVAALLVEAGRMDGNFDDTERQTIEQLLRLRFNLDSEAAGRLLATAERVNAESTQLFRFTHLVVERLAPEQRVRVIEMLWETVYAHGVVSPSQDALIRRVAGLIYVSDRDRGDARQRVLQRLGSFG